MVDGMTVNAIGNAQIISSRIMQRALRLYSWEQSEAPRAQATIEQKKWRTP